MSEPEIDREIVRDVKAFISDDDEKQRIIERIIEYEEDENDSWDASSDVSIKPAYIGILKSEPFIEVELDTNNFTMLKLKDLNSTKKALKDVKDSPDKHSREWFEENSGVTISDVLNEETLDENDKKEIKEIIEDVDALDYWSKYIAPSLKFRERAKKAILLMLASPEDKYSNKGRINALFYGPPGTGKTVIKNYLDEEFKAQTIDGPRVSKADITYNKSKDEIGQLPKAHKGVIVVEEADEMDADALGAALTSLGESGQVEIRDMVIPAEVRGVMLGNFDSPEQIKRKWSPESLNRFDFVIEFDRLTDKEKDETLDWHYEYFRQPKPGENKDLLKKYLKLVKQYEPEIEELEEIKDYKENNIDDVTNVREGISVMNVAWTIARLNFSDVTLSHYKKAFSLVTN